MTLPRFDYVRPSSIDEAFDLLALHRERARVLTGGQSLIPSLVAGDVDVDVLIDLGDLPAPAASASDGRLVLGWSVTQSEAESCGVSALERVLPLVGHRQTRNRGTICGSLAHGDPVGEIPLAFAVAGCHVVAASKRGERVIDARAFVSGADRLEPDEVLIESVWSHDGGNTQAAADEVVQSTTVVAAIAQVATETTSVAVAGPARGPLAFDFDTPHLDSIRQTLETALVSVEFIADRQGSADYRRTVAVELAVRATAQCLADGAPQDPTP